jgi:tRNA threonylcarbamoyladenosine biosynthesis protein TsaE
VSESREAFLPDEAATLSLGARLAQQLAPGMFVAVRGELGSGKTTLVRGMLRALGYAGRVKSPTYTLVEFYELSKLDFYHFDFYRFTDPHEIVDAGLRDAFNPRSVCVVEWPERAGVFLPRPDLKVALSVSGTGRMARIEAESEVGRKCLLELPL